MECLDQHYIEYYKPLINDFIREISSLEHPNIPGMPEPHLPLFGKNYKSAAVRILIVGQDTRGWGDLIQFIKKESEDPGCKLHEGLTEFRERTFTKWGATKNTFWGFAMMILAKIHRQDDWTIMKHGELFEILDSFAWSEGNAIELYSSTPVKKSISIDYWEKIRRAGDRFNRFRHIAETISPHLVIILNRQLNLDNYFEGYERNAITTDGRLNHFRLPKLNVDVIHAPHPRSMHYHEGADYFAERIESVFSQRMITAPFPKFISGQDDSQDIIAFFLNNLPRIEEIKGPSKYEFVGFVADELCKRKIFMSVPALIKLVNAKGGRTNYGTEFTGGRGSYKLVSGTYQRLIKSGHNDRANNVAIAFRRPNFQYAYSDD